MAEYGQELCALFHTRNARRLIRGMAAEQIMRDDPELIRKLIPASEAVWNHGAGRPGPYQPEEDRDL